VRAGRRRPGRAAEGETAGRPAAGGVHHGGGFPLGGVFAWYYGGRIVQGLVTGGSYAPVAGRAYRSPTGFVTGRSGGRGFGGGAARAQGRSGVSRGGFGSTGAGRVGGG
jgi:hypothetical protein